MLVNGLLLIILTVCVVVMIKYIGKRVNKANYIILKRNEVSALVVNCNNYKPIGDVFFSLNNLLKDIQESDYIEYKGHF